MFHPGIHSSCYADISKPFFKYAHIKSSHVKQTVFTSNLLGLGHPWDFFLSAVPAWSCSRPRLNPTCKPTAARVRQQRRPIDDIYSLRLLIGRTEEMAASPRRLRLMHIWTSSRTNYQSRGAEEVELWSPLNTRSLSFVPERDRGRRDTHPQELTPFEPFHRSLSDRLPLVHHRPHTRSQSVCLNYHSVLIKQLSISLFDMN